MCKQKINNKLIFTIAIPIILSNIGTPLVGLVDTVIMGRFDDPKFIGGVAIGSMIFSLLYWSFSFLRAGTTGLTSQAIGKNDQKLADTHLIRALILSLIFGSLIILVQYPIQIFTYQLLNADVEIEDLSKDYFHIRVWSAPAVFALYSIQGWLIGLQKTKYIFFIQVFLNLSNIFLNLTFAYFMNLGVKGIALGTLIAEILTVLICLIVLLKNKYKSFKKNVSYEFIFNKKSFFNTLSINKNFMIRSLSLIFIFVFFTAKSAEFGKVTLAVNTVLLHFVTFSSFFLDAFAITAETLVGKAIGEKNKMMLNKVISLTTKWAVFFALIASLTIIFFGQYFINFMTVTPDIRNLAKLFLIWAGIAPLLGVWCYQLDGFFIGATLGNEIKKAMIFSTIIFIITWYITKPLGNNGLWIALNFSYMIRTLSLLFFFSKLKKLII